MRTAYKCRAYPDSEQAAQLGRTFGCVRLVWNRTLDARHRRYHVDGKFTSYKETDAQLAAWKKTEDLGFLSEVSSAPLQQTLRHQHTAYQNFFAGRAKYPRFKNRTGKQSAHYTRSAFKLRGGRLRLAKQTVPLNFVGSWDADTLAALNPTMVVVSRDPDGRWYVTFAVGTEAPDPAAPTGGAIGIDLGVKDFATLSTGETIANPRHLNRRARNLARYQRRMARNLARYQRRMARNLARYQRRMARKQKAGLNRRILDASLGEFRRQLEYKTTRAGTTLIVVDRWYPSSKTCSSCGHLLSTLKLSVRRWTCPDCGTWHDRDHNAAKNIRAAGRAVAGQQPAEACGAGVSPQGSSLRQSAMNQEASGASPMGTPAPWGRE